MASSRTARRAETPAARLARIVADEVRQAIGRRASVTLALSGGVDSIVLLELLRQVCRAQGLALRVLHVNHGLSPNADAWERFCRVHCRRRSVPFEAVRVRVQGGGANLEAQARVARYGAFAASGAGVLALAHQRDDQAETVLLRLLRGAGVQGLGAMAAARPLEHQVSAAALEHDASRLLIRPLLGVGRDEILAYARRKRLRWIEDESNADERHARNFLRARVIPLLETRFPGARSTLARASAHLAEAAELLEQLAALDGADAVVDGRVSVARLVTLGPARAGNVLRRYLAAHGIAPPSTARTREMLRQLCGGRGDAQPEIRLGHMNLRRFRDWIALVAAVPDGSAVEAVAWNGQARLRLPWGGELRAVATRGAGVSAARLADRPVSVRLRRGGERMRLESARPTRTLKNLMQEADIAPWLRGRMPLVYCADELVWAPHIGIAHAYRACAGERALRFAWVEPAPAPRDD